MKKKNILLIIISIIILILAATIGLAIIKKINKNKIDYQIESVTEYKYFVMKSNQKFGVIDETGKIIIDASYDKIEIPNPSKDVFICYKNEKGIAINSNNQQLFAEYNSIEPINLNNIVTDLPYEKTVLKSEKSGQYGLIDFSGNEILSTEYESIEGFTGIEGILQIKKNDKVGVANIKGTILIKPEYDVVLGDNYYKEESDNIHQQGFIVGEKKDDGYKYGYVNYKGKLKVKLEYNDISRITDIPSKEGTYLIAARNGQYGVIKDKKNIINNEYQSIEYDNTNRVFIIEKGKNYGVADISGNLIIPIENTNIKSKGLYIYVEKNNIREVYDASGNKANIDYNQTIMPTSNDNYKITIVSKESGNYYGVLDINNKQIIDSEYLYIEYAFNNYFIACGQNGKLGVLNSEGKTVIDLKYDLVQKVQGKNIIQTLLTNTNTTEIYSEKMNKIFEMQNATLENKENYIKLYSNKEIKYFNNEGESINASQIFTNNKIFAATKNGKWGYVDSNGKTIIDYEYEFANELNEYKYAAIKKDGKWGAIDENGKIIVEPKYELNDKYSNIEFIGEYIKDNDSFGIDYYTKEK